MAVQKWIVKKDIPKNLSPKQAENWKKKAFLMLEQQLSGMVSDMKAECEIVLDNAKGWEGDDKEWKDTLKYWNKEIRDTMNHMISLRKQIEKNRR